MVSDTLSDLTPHLCDTVMSFVLYILFVWISLIANEPDELCASMYSFHSSPEEKNKLLFALSQHGIETTVDRLAKKKRIRDWIQESVIQEDDEEEEEDDGENVEPINHRAPVAGHVSTVRAQEKQAKQEKIPRTQIVSTVKSAENKHINPRTGQIQQGPSKMGDHESSDHGSNERIPQNNITPPERLPRKSTKLIDVGSQTSSESQKLRETMATNQRATAIDDAYSTSTPLIAQNQAQYSYTQSTQTGPPTEPVGLSSAFNSLTTVGIVACPTETQLTNPMEQRFRDRSQPRHASYHHHRHPSNQTNVLSRQPISRSMHNFNSMVNDSGYGSLDKLRPIEPTMSLLSSPTLSKRSLIKASVPSATHANGNGTTSNERIHINGLSHSQHESDSGGESPFGSNGFVNCVDSMEVAQRRPAKPISMKDTVYDRSIVYHRRKKT